eukprot:scaffold345778_cov15-Prasinocladus_malaysianus.AAC.1
MAIDIYAAISLPACHGARLSVSSKTKQGNRARERGGFIGIWRMPVARTSTSISRDTPPQPRTSTPQAPRASQLTTLLKGRRAKWVVELSMCRRTDYRLQIRVATTSPIRVATPVE